MAKKSLTSAQLKETSVSLTSGLALVVMDVEPEYCDPAMPEWLSWMIKPEKLQSGGKKLSEDELLAPHVRGNKQTHEAATKIAVIAPQFRQAAIPVIAVHVDLGNFDKPKTPVFHIFKTEQGDQIFPKNSTSAFKSTLREKFPALKPFNSILSQTGIKTIIICGVNEHACVADTALDARKKGYNVVLLTDAVADDNRQKIRPQTNALKDQEMKDAGVIFMSSAEALKKIRTAQKIMVAA